MYLAYEEYKMFGGELTSIEFDRFAFMAEREIDNTTLNRCKELTHLPESIKRCTFELIEYLAKNNNNGATMPISSFSNDGYSATYVEPKTAEKQIYSIIETYLSSEGNLLYCGVE